jgi:ParB family chromosome partitioning protein
MSSKQPAQRRGLGRGLGSLIPTGPPEQSRSRADEMDAPPPSSYIGAHAAGTESGATSAPPSENTDGVAPDPAVATQAEERSADVAGVYFAELPTSSITPNARQPRRDFDEGAMAELVHSIKEVGLLQPVVVRRTGEATYELIMGERRWRATQEAGLDTIPAIVRQTGDDAMLRDALLENLHRSELNPLEEAAAYRQLLDDFGCTHDELAGRIGRSRPQISNTLRLLNLSPSVQRRPCAAGTDRRRCPGPARRAGGRRGHLRARARGARGRG